MTKVRGRQNIVGNNTIHGGQNYNERPATMNISGNVGGDVAGGNVTKTGNTESHGESKWPYIAIVMIVLIMGLAWGANSFYFKFGYFGGQSQSKPLK